MHEFLQFTWILKKRILNYYIKNDLDFYILKVLLGIYQLSSHVHLWRKAKMNIYVGNLSYKMTDEDLGKLFSTYGAVSESKIVIDRETGRSKGFGFVEMPNQAEGDEAIKQLDGKEIEGRSIKVNVAKPKEDKPRRSQRY